MVRSRYVARMELISSARVWGSYGKCLSLALEARTAREAKG